MSAEMAAEQLLAEEAADQARAEAKKAKKQRQKAKKLQAQTVFHAQQSRQTEQSFSHGTQESLLAQQEEHQTQHAQQEEPQAQRTQHEEQQAQHAQQEEQQAQHAQQCPQFTEHEQDSLAVQDAGQPLIKQHTSPSQHAQQALNSQQAAQFEQPLSRQQTQQLGQACQHGLASSEEQLSAGTEARPHCLNGNSHHQHEQLANGVLPVMPQSEGVSQTVVSADAAAQPSLDQNSQLASTSRHTAAQSMDDKALFNLFCCPLTKVLALCACTLK